ncbi:hypothetical protein GCM10027022_08620 [Alpinimonas psychrophila]|jgi:hypothetical protein|uniref:Uncharacterized protein n=1 Tax=Alpinimonas psychrophila TaxID=748908 RepID=A0A7W3JT90_9MICO|nr:hypothetical protein [Alpinimonas psychrophila]MBA8828682.1 hypothetical protein [Alpinimonas psychrophila]
MQLGTRWNLWKPAPAGLPELVLAAIHSTEADLTAVAAINPDVGIDSWRWTLTWLEGRPVVELDDGTTIRVDTHGLVTVTDDSDDA